MGYRSILIILLTALVVIPPIISLTLRPKKAKDNKPAQLTAIGLGVFLVAFCAHFYTWGMAMDPSLHFLIRYVGIGGTLLTVAGAIWSIVRYCRQ